MACLVLFWAGSAIAVDQLPAAPELTEQVQSVDTAADEKLDQGSLDPFDCPLACTPDFRARLLPAAPPDEVHPAWRSIVPRLTPPPPRRA